MQKQLVVSPNSMTLEPLGEGKHFGQVNCPFCDKLIRLILPLNGFSCAYTFDNCSHNQGAIMGHGYDVTVLFNQ